jgi:hypothetical protein
MTADEQVPLHEDIILYSTPDGAVRMEVVFEGETFWLTQRRMADLFGVGVPTISHHLKEIYKSHELNAMATVRRIRTVQTEGGRKVDRELDFYHLDAIIAVGYRVNSREATQFRIWSTQVLREYLIKGFVLDDERLKQGKRLGKDYFDELLERIRSIRASERRFYLKITDIYEQCSIDYNQGAEITQMFFKTVQNKLHWAITGKTAAELIAERAQASQPNMGLKTWKNAPQGRIQKADVAVAKNYLEENELKALERIVSMYLDYAENQASRQIPMRMADWVEKLDAFLKFNEYDVLTNAGRVSHEVPQQAKHESVVAKSQVCSTVSFTAVLDGEYEDGVSEILKAKTVVANAQAQFGRLNVLEALYIAFAGGEISGDDAQDMKGRGLVNGAEVGLGLLRPGYLLGHGLLA